VTSGDATVSDLLDLYLADQRKQKRKAYKSAEGFVRLHLRPAFGKINADRLTTQMINSFVAQKQAADYADASINRYLEALIRGLSARHREPSAARLRGAQDRAARGEQTYAKVFSSTINMCSCATSCRTTKS